MDNDKQTTTDRPTRRISFFEHLEALLKTNGDYVAEDGRLLRNKVAEAAATLDPALLRLLLSDDEAKKRFFTEVDGTKVFDKAAFCWTVENRAFLPDSFTSFKNRIGLTDAGGGFVASSPDVVISFPYKDCVLEGGQTKEDQKRREVFYNRVLAPDEVDRLLEPKALCKAVRHDADGSRPVTEFDPATDNLVIKGNNLLALASLLPRYEGKVKLIYIDPPYNTGNDSFGYNDSFNRSTWLVFMKNRLELARRLLSQDGAIYIQLDYNQVHYAKVLMDEVFGEKNFQREIIWRIGWVSGYKTNDNNWIRNHDTILFYARDSSFLAFDKRYIPAEDFKEIAKAWGQEHRIPERYPIEDVWNGNEYDDLNSIAIVSFAGETVSKMLNAEDEIKGQKSEKLIERIVNAHTKEGDLVLDFFGGSGTTGAVCLKMKRRFIVCEQLDKHIDIMERRLVKVIQGERSGISRHNGWAGGGSFVSCELAACNGRFAEEIGAAEDDGALTGLLWKIVGTGYASHRAWTKDLKRYEEEFKALGVEEKRQVLFELLDANMLYVARADAEDAESGLTDADKAFTRSFYGE